jgi:hypothetical protein
MPHVKAKILTQILMPAIFVLMASSALAGESMYDPERPRQTLTNQNPKYGDLAATRARNWMPHILNRLLPVAAQKHRKVNGVLGRFRRGYVISKHTNMQMCGTGGVAQFYYRPNGTLEISVCPVFASFTDRFAQHILIHEALHADVNDMASGECGVDLIAHFVEVAAGLGYIGGGALDKACGTNASNYTQMAQPYVAGWLGIKGNEQPRDSIQ